MSDRINTEQLAEKLKKSLLPIEFNRQKELYKWLNHQRFLEDEKCQKVMKDIIEKKSKGEDIESLYQVLVAHRRKRDIYATEEKEVLEK